MILATELLVVLLAVVAAEDFDVDDDDVVAGRCQVGRVFPAVLLISIN